MCAGAVGATFDERRAFAATSTTDGCGCEFCDGQNIVAVDFESRHAVRRSTTANTGVATGITKRYFRGVLVVFADEEHRQLPDGSHVEPFMKGRRY
jgi:hypothetical protein